MALVNSLLSYLFWIILGIGAILLYQKYKYKVVIVMFCASVLMVLTFVMMHAYQQIYAVSENLLKFTIDVVRPVRAFISTVFAIAFFVYAIQTKNE